MVIFYKYLFIINKYLDDNYMVGFIFFFDSINLYLF